MSKTYNDILLFGSSNSHFIVVTENNQIYGWSPDQNNMATWGVKRLVEMENEIDVKRIVR